MTRIAFILICHKNPDGVVQQVRTLTSSGDVVSVHMDKRARPEDWEVVHEALKDDPNVCLAQRVKGGWGEWSLVAATLNAIRAVQARFSDATHYYFLSGDCMPIKSRAYMARFLADNPYDFVEHNDFYASDWIKTGIKEERLIYRHYFNERSQKAWFYRSMRIQRSLGLKRDIPADLKIMIGSQWCLLRASTVEKVMAFVDARPDVVRFFSTTWIPDETFFQTLVMHLVPRTEVRNQTLTYLAFSDYGMPVTFHDDQFDLLKAQEYLFARKISEHALTLRERLRDLFREGFEALETANTARPLFDYLSQRGRIGRRFAPRFWERGGQIGRGSEILIVACKKWHVGRRFLHAVKSVKGAPESLGYIFDEEQDVLPSLGGIESSTEKRGRHRRAFLRLLFEVHGTERLLICLDPSNIDTVRDLAGDDCSLRLLEIRCTVDDGYLAGHAARIGLTGSEAQAQGSGPLLLALRRQFRDESDALRDLGLQHSYLLEQNGEPEQNAEAVARFLGLPPARASQIVQTPNLFE